MKRPTDNVTLTLGYPVGGEQNSSSKHSFGVAMASATAKCLRLCRQIFVPSATLLIVFRHGRISDRRSRSTSMHVCEWGDDPNASLPLLHIREEDASDFAFPSAAIHVIEVTLRLCIVARWTALPQRVGFPLRTASTTSRIAPITSCGCSLCISWPLFVCVMCFSLGTRFASRSCAFFSAASTIYPKSGGTSAGNLPAALIDRTWGPQGRSAERTTMGIGRSAGAARI